MEKNEIKKALYREKPIARFIMIRQGNAYYCTTLKDGSTIPFIIPITDMGDADFSARMDAKLLNRWIEQE